MNICAVEFERKHFDVSRAEAWLDKQNIEVVPDGIIEGKNGNLIYAIPDCEVPDKVKTTPAGLGVLWVFAADKKEKPEPSRPAMVDIFGVEIFQAGSWTSSVGITTEYSEAELKQCAEDTNALVKNKHLEPPLKIGHNEKQTLMDDEHPSLGWLHNFRVKAGKLICDIKDVPQKLADLIGTGAYKKRSCEFFFDYYDESAKKKFKRIVAGLALLGAKLPALGSLKDIEGLYMTTPASTGYAYQIGHDGIEPIEIIHQEGGGSMEDKEKFEKLQKEVAELTQKFEKVESEKSTFEQKVTVLETEKAELAKDATEKDVKIQAFEKEKADREKAEADAKAKRISEILDMNAKKFEPKHRDMFAKMLDANEADAKSMFESLPVRAEFAEAGEHGTERKGEDPDETAMKAYCDKNKLNYNSVEGYREAYRAVVKYTKPPQIAAE